MLLACAVAICAGLIFIAPHNKYHPAVAEGVSHLHMHTSAYVSIRQHTSGVYGAEARTGFSKPKEPRPRISTLHMHTSAYVSIRQHTSAYVSIRRSRRSQTQRVSICAFVLVMFVRLYLCFCARVFEAERARAADLNALEHTVSVFVLLYWQRKETTYHSASVFVLLY